MANGEGSWLDPISQPLAELLAPLFGKTPEELKPQIEGVLLIIILIIAAVIGFKILMAIM